MYIIDIFHLLRPHYHNDSKQGNLNDMFSFWKHTKRNKKINEATNRLYI